MSRSKQNNDADERTPLVNGESSSGNRHSHILQPSDSGVSGFLFNSKHTPGTDSDNFAVRGLAHAWHIAKVTLLSST